MSKRGWLFLAGLNLFWVIFNGVTYTKTPLSTTGQLHLFLVGFSAGIALMCLAQAKSARWRACWKRTKGDVHAQTQVVILSRA